MSYTHSREALLHEATQLHQKFKTLRDDLKTMSPEQITECKEDTLPSALHIREGLHDHLLLDSRDTECMRAYFTMTVLVKTLERTR